MSEPIKQTRGIDALVHMARIQQTCEACPSQWEGATQDERYVYIRYRWGRLSVSVDGETVYCQDIGDALDGTLSWGEMMQYTSHVMIWDECEVG
jgi:hypothetical protein